MQSSSPRKQHISFQAYLQQMQNWQLTLTRQQKKLKNLFMKMHSKILINETQILITEIEAELIKYKKIRNKNGYDFYKNKIKESEPIDVIALYNKNSRKFMDLMENIGDFVDKVEGMVGEGVTVNEEEYNEGHKVQKNNRTYQQQTFTYTISKSQKSKPTTPMASKSTSKNIQKKLPQKNSNKSMLGIQPSKKRSTNKTSPLQSLQLPSFPNSHTQSQFHSHSPLQSQSHLQSQSQSQSQMDSWQMRYQLKQIKSMMAQIQNQIRYHTHEDIELQLSKLQHNNKKLSLEVKSLREDSQYIVTRIQKLKQQLATEKQIQSQMIQQFENPHKEHRLYESRKNKAKSYSIQNSRIRNNQRSSDKKDHHSTIDGISEWVKVRI